MLHGITTAFLGRVGPYLSVRLVTAAYAVSAIGRLIPVKRNQVPGYRRQVQAPIWTSGSARHHTRPGKRSYPLSPRPRSGPSRLFGGRRTGFRLEAGRGGLADATKDALRRLEESLDG
jgi:hypothetical protein